MLDSLEVLKHTPKAGREPAMSVSFTPKKAPKKSVGFFSAFLARQRERELPLILRFQSRRNTFFDWYFFIASVLGEEIFFISFIPFCCWNVSRQVALHLTFLLAFSVGGGNMLKNYIKSPRPSPKIVWVNRSNPESDSGFPSTHTMTAFTIPWYLLVFYWETTATPTILMGLAVLLLWSLSIAVSRVYNGHHFIVDVIGGFFLSIGIMVVWSQYLRYVIDPIISHPSLLVPVVFIGGAIALLYLHPRPPPNNPTITETSLVLGTCLGTFLAIWTHHYSQLPTGFGYKIVGTMDVFSDALALLVARFVIGGALVAVVRELAKRISLPLLLLGHTKYTNSIYSPKKDKRIVYNRTNYKHSVVDTALKLITYTAVSFSVTAVVPHLCCMLGLFHESDLVVFEK